MVTAHGEGRALFTRGQAPEEAIVAMRFVDNRGAATESYPYNVERLAARHHRRHHRRRPLHDRHAAPGARLPHRPDVLAPRRLGRGQPLDAPLPEREGVGRLIRPAPPPFAPLRGPPPPQHEPEEGRRVEVEDHRDARSCRRRARLSVGLDGRGGARGRAVEKRSESGRRSSGLPGQDRDPALRRS